MLSIIIVALVIGILVTTSYLIYANKTSPKTREWLIILLRFLIFLIVAAAGIIIAALSDISF